MIFRTLTVLMWRHLLSRKRADVSTIIEFVIPILPFVLIFLVRTMIFQRRPVPGEFRSVETPEASPLKSVPGPPCVLFTPETNFIKYLMDLVAQKLNLHLFNSLPGTNSSNKKFYFPFTNASSIFWFTRNMGPDEAVVVFHNMEGVIWPDSLNYSIRMKAPFKTNRLSDNDDPDHLVALPHKEFGTIYKPFMRLQWAIDTSFIEILSGKQVTQELTTQEFPLVEYTGKYNVYSFKADVLFFAADIAILPAFFTFMLRKLTEKESGVQELMKLMGVTTYTLFTSHVLNSLLPGLVYAIGATFLIISEPSAVLAKSNGFLIFLALFLQFTFTITMAMVCCYLVGSSASPTASTILALYLLIILPAHIFSSMELSAIMVIPCGLVPYMPLSWIFKEASRLETMGHGLTVETMMTSHTPLTGPALVAYIFLMLHIIVCLISFWYLDHVIPGIYGSTYPWNFFCKKEYWSKSAAESKTKVEKREMSNKDLQYFESPPKHLEPGIQVINVTKDFNKERALDNVSLDVYKGEITILLGHNSAGKSTLMHVITGMIPVTKGKVLVNGLNIQSEKALARQHIGFCPQQNMFLENLSVIEHVMFFTLLNSGTFKEARKSSEELLQKLHLKDKAVNSTYELSEGMKKRLQLACALAGQSSVLLLDEPTSGLDVETRRALWDLLLSLRESRTVLLSTHFMEEADALGDRVAALRDGQLRCHASPMYLKRAIDTGYRLTLITNGRPKAAAITNVVQSIIPNATIQETNFNSIEFSLPSADSTTFPKLFAELESRTTELGIDTIEVGTSTLEEVFLRLCSNVGSDLEVDDEMEKHIDSQYNKLTGVPLYFRQTQALIIRYLRFLWVYKITQIGFGVIRVVILILVVTFITNDVRRTPRDKTHQAMNLDLYQSSPDYRILYKVNGSEADLRPLSDQYPRVHFEKTSDVSEAILRTTQHDKIEYNNYLAGIELNDTNAKVMYTTTVRHVAPAALNLLSNLVATRLIPGADGRTITTYNHPLSGAYTTYAITDIIEPKSPSNSNLWLFSTTLLLLSGIIFMIQLPCKEAAGARHIHILAGCSPELHWTVMLLVSVLQVFLTYVTTLVIACLFLEHDNTFSDKDFIIAVSVVVVLGSMAMLAFSYHFTFYFSQNTTVAIIAFINILIVLIFPILWGVVPSLEKLKPIAMVAVPPHTFDQAMMECIATAYLNSLCKLNRDKCPALAIPVPNFDAHLCCESKTSNPWCYFCFKETSPGLNILFLIIQVLIYMTFVILTQRGFFTLIWEKIINNRYKEPVPKCNDKAVSEEQMYVKEKITQPPKTIPDILLVSNLHKNHRSCCSSFNAVRGVSFSVKKGECFGLLGVNGAGKSSLFRVLTAEECPTKGKVFANGHKLTFPYCTGYVYSIGYCPQFWALHDFLTARQNLNLLLALNGLNKRDANADTLTWIKLVGLEKYTDQLVSEYSSGCLRRMAAVCALCTDAPISLLDEPTAGVDVAARRRVWIALRRALRDQRSIIITSHSLEEIEALCHRIAIMASGEICALGSPAALRAAHTAGHSIIMKIKNEPVTSVEAGVPMTTYPNVDLLKSAIEQKFKCNLKDEHKTMLHYQIDETIDYSKLFQAMEELKVSFPDLIEDYAISEPTLEEVYLSFAKTSPKPEEDASRDVKKASKKNNVTAGPA